MKKPVVRFASGLLALLVMLSSGTWAAADESLEEQTAAVAADESLDGQTTVAADESLDGQRTTVPNEGLERQTASVPNESLEVRAASETAPGTMLTGEAARKDFEDQWNLAAENGNITVTLNGNVEAVGGSFGTGTGFDDGAIVVPNNKSISLQLNGYKINRGLTSPKANGYVIKIMPGASLTIEDAPVPGGSITGGYNSAMCGGIYVHGGHLCVKSGTIEGNKAGTYGGGIYAVFGGSVDFQGGTLRDNTATNGSGGGMYISSDCSATISGGRISGNKANGIGGGILAYSQGKAVLKFSGDPQITGNTNTASPGAGTSNVALGNACTMSLGTLESPASIGVDKTFSNGETEFKIADGSEGANLQENLKYLFADNSGKHLEVDGNSIKLLDGAPSHTHALNVGCDSCITDGADKLLFNPVTVLAGLSGGSYYLADDIEITQPIAVTGLVNLCLNGHSITMRSTEAGMYPVFSVEGTGELNICDCNSTNLTHEIQPYDEIVTINGGVITGGNITVNSSREFGGGGVHVNTNGKLNLYGGTIAGNSCTATASAIGAPFGGGVCLKKTATFNMYGGAVSYNKVSVNKDSYGWGGGVALEGDDGTFRMKGGKIQYNRANRTDEEAPGSGYAGGIAVSGLYSSLEISNNAVVSDNLGLGGVYVSMDTSVSKISGNVKIQNNVYQLGTQKKVYNLYLYDGKVLSAGSGGLTSNAKIGISTRVRPTEDNPIQITSTGFLESDKNYFFADDSEKYHIGWNRDGGYFEMLLGGSQESAHTHDGSTFTELPANPGTLSSGSYYLTENVTLTGTVQITGPVNLCLNGHTITGPSGGAPAFLVKNGAALNLYNNEYTGSETGTNIFAGLSGSGGVKVEGGGALTMYAKDGSELKSYKPEAGSAGGKVTVGTGGTVTTTPEGGGGPTTGSHKTDHPDPSGSFQAINRGNFGTVTSANPPAGYQGALPEKQSAYKFLVPGKYYLDGNFVMPSALIVVPDAGGAATDFCLYGSNLGADNDTWLYEMQHVFWVPEKTTLNVVDCQRDLHIVWLYGGRVFLKKGGTVNISGKLPDYITTIKMAGEEGEVVVKHETGRPPVISLPSGATLTQKMPGNKTQVIKNNGGVLTVTSDSGAATTVTPPAAGGSIDLKLPESASGAPPIALEAPAGSTAQTGSGPKITLEQPGEVADDGTVTSRAVTVTTKDPATGEDVEVVVIAPAGKTVGVSTTGQVTAPQGSTVTVGDVSVTVDEIGGTDPKTVMVTPGGQINLPAGSQATAANPKKGGATIVIALPDEKGDGTLGVTETGVQPSQNCKLSTKKGSVTIVIALPYPVKPGDPMPEIDFGKDGTLILPPEATVTRRDGDGQGKTETVQEGKPVLDPDTGELTGKTPPVNPNTPTNPEEIPDDTTVDKGGVTVEKDPGNGTITVTPTTPGGTPVVITPDPDAPPGTPVVDDTGKVFPDAPFTVEPKGDGPTVTGSKDGSVDPDGTVTANTVTVEPKDPDNPPTTMTAPEGDAIKVAPDGTAQVPEGTELEQGGAKVTIDDVPDPTVPVTVKPDGTAELPEKSEITVTPKPEQPDQPSRPYTVKIEDVPGPNKPEVKPDGTVDLPGGSVITVTPKPRPGDEEQPYKVTLPSGGGEVKPGPDGKITLPQNTTVEKPDGTKITITDPEGAIDPSTGEITGGGNTPGGGDDPGNTPGGGDDPGGDTPGGGDDPGGGDNPGGDTPGGGGDSDDDDDDDDDEDSGGGGSPSGGSSGGSSTASYVIQASAGVGGTIRPRGRTQVAAGTDKTFVIAPQTGYDVKDVLVDGVSVCAVTSYTFRNIRKNHTIQASFAASGSPGLLDTEDHRDYLHGFTDGLFRPDASMTRAQAAQMFYNLLRDQNVPGKGGFTDVPEEMWCYEAVSALKALGIMQGVTEARFEPNRPITRAELVVTAVRFTEHRQGTASFADVEETDWYYPEISAAASRGWIGGYAGGTFRPNNPITRAQTASVINRLLGRQADEDFLEKRPDGLRSFPDARPGYWAYEDVMEAANAHEYLTQSGGERWTELR